MYSIIGHSKHSRHSEHSKQSKQRGAAWILVTGDTVGSCPTSNNKATRCALTDTADNIASAMSFVAIPGLQKDYQTRLYTIRTLLALLSYWWVSESKQQCGEIVKAFGTYHTTCTHDRDKRIKIEILLKKNACRGLVWYTYTCQLRYVVLAPAFSYKGY